jgi:hypothetical protein
LTSPSGAGASPPSTTAGALPTDCFMFFEISLSHFKEHAS